MTSTNSEKDPVGKREIKTLVRTLQDLCFPPFCLCCESPLPDSHLLICAECFSELQFTCSPMCGKCGRVFPGRGGKNHLCSQCISTKVYYNRAISLFVYNKPVSSLIAGLKYSRNTAGLETFTKLLKKSNHVSELDEPDYIIPVPLHPEKLRQRGFNQALLLAASFFSGEKKKIKRRILIKTRQTLSQTGLSGSERRKNLKNAFCIREPSRVVGKKILLVDDVYTTGTTVNECARTIMSAGAVNVDVLTLARVRE